MTQAILTLTMIPYDDTASYGDVEVIENDN